MAILWVESRESRRLPSWLALVILGLLLGLGIAGMVEESRYSSMDESGMDLSKVQDY